MFCAVMARVKRIQAEARREDASKGKESLIVMKAKRGVIKSSRIVPEKTTSKVKPEILATARDKEVSCYDKSASGKGAFPAYSARDCARYPL